MSPNEDQFPDTRWSLVIRIRSDDDEIAHEALSEICRTYWRPLYRFLRLQGDSREQAEDVVQGFFEKILEKGWLERVAPPDETEGSDDHAVRKARLRSYLLACLRAYRAKEYRREQAVKRGGGLFKLSLDIDTAEAGLAEVAASGRSPEAEFDRAWALEVIGRAQDALRRRYEAKGKGPLFTALEPFLAGSETEESYADLGARLGITESKVKTEMHRLRSRLRGSILEEVSRTIEERSDITIEDELTHLLMALS